MNNSPKAGCLSLVIAVGVVAALLAAPSLLEVTGIGALIPPSMRLFLGIGWVTLLICAPAIGACLGGFNPYLPKD